VLRTLSDKYISAVGTWSGVVVSCKLRYLCLQEALQELEELKEIVPKESLVYFLIAKVS